MANIQIKDLISTTPTDVDVVPLSQGGNTRKATIQDIRGVVDSLTTGGTTKALSAEQGKILDTKKANQTDLDTTNTNVTNIETEIQNARGGESNLDARIDKIDDKIGVLSGSTTTNKTDIIAITNEINANKADKASLDAMAVYNATCAYTTNVFTLTLANAPVTLPNFFTVRVKMPSAWVDASTIKIGTKTYTVTNAGFVENEVVIINFDEVASTCFFKSGGGGGLIETLPQQVDTFTATSGNGIINLTWSNSNTNYLSGYYIIYKTGGYPTTINDGTKIDITNISATSQQITGLTNNIAYYCRICPYNSKKQVQTEYKVATATPMAGLDISNLSLYSKVVINGYNFIVLDKNHTGYPSNSVTLLCENIPVSRVVNTITTSNKYSTSDINNWLTTTFVGYLTSITTSILDTTIRVIKSSSDGGGYEDIIRKVFLLSNTEIGYTNENSIAEGTLFSYFTSDSTRIAKNTSNIATDYWLRTPYFNQIYQRFCSAGGVMGAGELNVSKGIRPVLNVANNLKVSLTPNGSGYYEIML